MPRTILDKPKRKPHENLARLLIGTVELQGKPREEVARVLDCSLPTARKRLREPGTLSIDDLCKLARWLSIPIEEIRAALTLN